MKFSRGHNLILTKKIFFFLYVAYEVPFLFSKIENFHAPPLSGLLFDKQGNNSAANGILHRLYNFLIIKNTLINTKITLRIILFSINFSENSWGIFKTTQKQKINLKPKETLQPFRLIFFYFTLLMRLLFSEDCKFPRSVLSGLLFLKQGNNSAAERNIASGTTSYWLASSGQTLQ